MDKIIVLDGGFCLHRAIFSNMNNEQIPATYTYCSMILGYLNRIKIDETTLIIVAQDYGKSWRKLEDLTYKAQRRAFRESKKSEEWWKKQYENFNIFIPSLERAVPWQFTKIYGLEADDIAGVCCRYFNENEVILVSSDADWTMLCAFPNVKIFSPLSKKYKEVQNPHKVLLEKIQGDVSDNLLTKPNTEEEFEKRKRIVDLIDLPIEVYNKVKEALDTMMPKTLNIHKFPYKSLALRLEKLYHE